MILPGVKPGGKGKELKVAQGEVVASVKKACRAPELGLLLVTNA
jgi:hypothetical protein